MTLNFSKGVIKLFFLSPILSMILFITGCSDDEPDSQKAMRDPDRERMAEYKEFKDKILKKE